jgi:hypothetical protein
MSSCVRLKYPKVPNNDDKRRYLDDQQKNPTQRLQNWQGLEHKQHALQYDTRMVTLTVTAVR